MNTIAEIKPHPGQFGSFTGALEGADVIEIRALTEEVIFTDSSNAAMGEWAQMENIESWPDARLIATVRCDPPDEKALDSLVERHWKALFGRCRMLTQDPERANDLAQETWFRVLRVRRTLRPDGNFPAYLAKVATNLWRDVNRSAHRAGPMACERMLSLNAELPGSEEGEVTLADALPDLNTLHAHQQAVLRLDIDRALERLTPLLRDILIARFLTGESCAEIGRAFGRTEQTISAWVREALRQMKVHLDEAN